MLTHSHTHTMYLFIMPHLPFLKTEERINLFPNVLLVPECLVRVLTPCLCHLIPFFYCINPLLNAWIHVTHKSWWRWIYCRAWSWCFRVTFTWGMSAYWNSAFEKVNMLLFFNPGILVLIKSDRLIHIVLKVFDRRSDVTIFSFLVHIVSQHASFL